MRPVVVASLVGLVALTVAAPAAAAPTEQPPAILSGSYSTESVLQAQGFVTPKVVYRVGASQDVVVVHDGGGPADPLEAIRQIEGTVWGVEGVRFDQLVIQNGRQAPFVVSYGKLEASIGPRQPGLDAVTPRDVAAFGAASSGTALAFVPFLGLLKVIVAVIGVTALLAVLAFGLASFLGTRARLRGESEDRLFA